jgi:biofilm PGA synthesis N-glycosyltransferase PgaC
MRILLESIFWLSALMLAYTFGGYPLILGWLARWRGRPHHKAPMEPTVSVLIAVHNGGTLVGRKLENVLSLPWPAHKMQVIVISDGSTDGTNKVVADYVQRDARVHLLSVPQNGKSAALNAGLQLAMGEILVLTDVRQMLEPGALTAMMSNYADPTVGGVSGTLHIGSMGSLGAVTGESLKWGIENAIREREGAIGSVVGALGAFYSIRRELFTPIPQGLLLDDMWVPLHVVRHGKRVVFEREARAWDDVRPTKEQEYRRKVRTLTGNYELIKKAPWLISNNPIFFQFFSHKITRLLAPFLLMALFCVTFALVQHPFYAAALVGEIVLIAFALFGMMKTRFGMISRVAEISHTFVLLNLAGLVAFLNFLRGRTNVWVRQ